MLIIRRSSFCNGRKISMATISIGTGARWAEAYVSDSFEMHPEYMNDRPVQPEAFHLLYADGRGDTSSCSTYVVSLNGWIASDCVRDIV